MKEVRELMPFVKLYRDDNNGIAWVEDHSTGHRVSAHPYISSTGSVAGMKKMGYWGKDDKIVESHGYMYNISRFVCDESDELEMVAAKECMCEKCKERRGTLVTDEMRSKLRALSILAEECSDHVFDDGDENGSAGILKLCDQITDRINAFLEK